MRPSVNFSRAWVAFLQLPSTIHAAGRPSVNFCQLPVQQKDLSSTSVNFLYGKETFHQILATFCAAGRTSDNPPATGRTSVNYRELSYGHETFHQIPSTFCAAGRPSVNFRQHSIRLGNLLSTFNNFPSGMNTFCRLSMRLLELLSSSTLCVAR